MILEDATKEAFNYGGGELPCKSNKLILTACEFCGRFKVTSKHNYHTFCKSCSLILGEKHKGKNHSMFGKYRSEVTKALVSANHADVSGKNNPSWKGGPIKRICLRCGKEFEVFPSGRGKYCSKDCGNKAKDKGGKKIAGKRSRAKRKRELGYILLFPVNSGEVGHHFTDVCVGGIPKEVHSSIGGRRREHRARVLEWLKKNDMEKYNLVLSIMDNKSYLNY